MPTLQHYVAIETHCPIVESCVVYAILIYGEVVYGIALEYVSGICIPE